MPKQTGCEHPGADLQLSRVGTDIFFVQALAVPICVRSGAGGAGRREAGAARQRGRGLRGTCRAVRGLVPGHAGAGLLAGLWPALVQQEGRAGSPPALTVPLGRTCGPGCHQGPVPSALAGADRWTHGPGKGLAGAGNS